MCYGRILRSESLRSEIQHLPHFQSYKTAEYHDVKNNRIFFIEDDCEAEIFDNTIDYFINNKKYTIEDNFLSIEYKTGDNAHKYELNSSRCSYCQQYHIFYGYIRNVGKHFTISSYCGLKLKYLYGYSAQEHEKRRKVVHAVIEYAKKMKEEK